MTSFNTVLFDLDGTILDTNKLILESFHHAFTNLYNNVPEDETLTSFFGMTLHEAFKSLAKQEKDVEKLISYFRDYNIANHDNNVKLFPGVTETFIKLKENDFKIGVVTSKLNKTAKRGLGLFDLEKYVDTFIGADDTPIHKPDPYPVLECLKRIGSAAENSIMVGDSPHDMIAGERSGCKTVFVNYSLVRINAETFKSDYRINKLEELTSILGIN